MAAAVRQSREFRPKNRFFFFSNTHFCACLVGVGAARVVCGPVGLRVGFRVGQAGRSLVRLCVFLVSLLSILI